MFFVLISDRQKGKKKKINMGGCATKPKVLKGEEGEAPAPAPAPEPAKEQVAAAGGGGAIPTTTTTTTLPSEAKDVVVVEECGDQKKAEEGDKKVDDDQPDATANDVEDNKEVNKEIVEDDKKVDGDHQETKPRSLSNLFKVTININMNFFFVLLISLFELVSMDLI